MYKSHSDRCNSKYKNMLILWNQHKVSNNDLSVSRLPHLVKFWKTPSNTCQFYLNVTNHRYICLVVPFKVVKDIEQDMSIFRSSQLVQGCLKHLDC